MRSATPWRPLDAFRDRAVPKLNNLREAARAGLDVPETWWAPAEELGRRVGTLPPVPGMAWPCIVRSGSPTEDGRLTSNAGRFLSLKVEEAGGFDAAVRRVLASLPAAEGGRLGVVFVQPWVRAEEAGVTFFDGFYYEETRADGGNAALTAGLERGEVRRGHVQRGDASDAWLAAVHKRFGGTIDVEWAEAAGRRMLLQVRPALFALKRCETLSLANHKEILGDPPSPWMTGVLAEAGRPVMGFYEAVDPGIAAWHETYAMELGGRAWMNFSAFFRIMDRWGMPRTMVTEGVGGESAGPRDEAYLWGPLLRALPVFPRLLWRCLATIVGIGRGLEGLGTSLAGARTLEDLWRVNVGALEFSIRTNFAIMSLLSAVVRMRRALGLNQAGRVVTQRMMAEYAALASRPTLEARLRGLDDWIASYGHRGPLESDPARPRFAELAAALRADLARGAAAAPTPRPQPAAWFARLTRPLFLLDEVRESFRDRLMRWWQKLRARILEEAGRAVAAGYLDRPEEVFDLGPDDLASDPMTWRARAVEGRARVEAARRLDLPTTAARDVLEVLIAREQAPEERDGRGRFAGIGLGEAVVWGTAVRATEVTDLLKGGPLPESAVLVVDALEPSWGVVFPRFAAVVADLGGELSHASILLREAGISAVVNARGAFRAIADGDAVCVDPKLGEVRVESRAREAGMSRVI